MTQTGTATPRTPPLHSLRAFDAVARGGSMQAAAAELHVTPGAISQQIKVLEHHLGLRLFDRKPRQLVLTADGEHFHRQIRRPLQALEEAASGLTPHSRPWLRVSATPTLANRWLQPLLSEWASLHSDLSIHLQADSNLTRFTHDNFDLAIRHCIQPGAHLEHQWLFAETCVAVCSPQYLAAHPAATATKALDWHRVTLLHHHNPWGWADWLEVHGLPTAALHRPGQHFSHTLLAISAALQHQGVVLTPVDWIRDDLSRGALLTLDHAPWSTGYHFYAVWPKRRPRPGVVKFVQWLALRQADLVNGTTSARHAIRPGHANEATTGG